MTKDNQLLNTTSEESYNYQYILRKILYILLVKKSKKVYFEQDMINNEIRLRLIELGFNTELNKVNRWEVTKLYIVNY